MVPKFYMLNIENCRDKKALGPVGELKEFVIMDGQYDCDFDVVEELLPPGICNAHRYETEWAKKNIDAWATPYNPGLHDDEIDFLPLGIDRRTIPEGAVITEIK